MSNRLSLASLDLSGLLKQKQLKTLLKSAIDIGLDLMFVTTAEEQILVHAARPTMPEEVLKNLLGTIQANLRAGTSLPAAYRMSRMPIEVHGQLAGFVVAVSFNDAAVDGPAVTGVAQLIGHIISEQAFKEYELKSLSAELLSRYEELTLLYEISQTIGSVFEVNTICDISLGMAMQVLRATRGFIALMNDEETYLKVIAVRGMKGFKGWEVPVGQGITGHVASTGEHVLLDAQEPAFDRPITQELRPSDRLKMPLEATLSVPLMLPVDQTTEKKGVLGVITLTGKAPGERFSAGDAKLLTTLAAQVTTAIHNSRLVSALREAERVRQQIKIAAQIQQSLLPKEAPQVPGLKLSGKCVSAANVGGDYYDFVVDEHNRLTFLIADASGHNVGSALMMVTARSLVRYEIARGKPLRSIIADTNRSIFDDLSQAEMFISMFCARFDVANGQLTFVNGGHNPPLLRQAATGQILPLDADGLLLGVLDEVEFEERSITLKTGDTLLLFTDGVIEARAPNGEQFGEVRLQKLLNDHGVLPPDELVERIYRMIRAYTEETVQQDDITLLILKLS
jgi:sigma-B regulation protein RsbU (phosphoserine phosphatase)